MSASTPGPLFGGTTQVGRTPTTDDINKALLDLLNKINIVYAHATLPVGMVYTQYPGTPTPTAIYGGIWKNITTTIGLSGQGGIYDSGSNANGTWIRYTDGTMVCTYNNNRTPSLNLVTPVNSSSVCYTSWNWTFPLPFISAPTGLTVTGDFVWGPGLEYHQAYSVTTTSCMIEEGILASVNPGSLSCNTYVTATGKWSSTAISPSTFWQCTTSP